MKRTPLVAGNWKMNKTLPESLVLLNDLKGRLHETGLTEVVVFPPFTSLAAAKTLLEGSPIGLGAQNLSSESKGAYTGEVSAEMLIEAGCQYVIVGHSERRHIFGETNEMINKKITTALSAGLNVIFCIGETKEERESGKTADVVFQQILGGLLGVKEEDMARVVIAYEPVWAIGTGLNATPPQAQEVHCVVRRWIEEKYGPECAAFLRIVYGGSVTPDNCEGLVEEPDIDGALVGGASLDAGSFCAIIESVR